MIVVRLAQFSVKRIIRHRGLTWALVMLPLIVAVARSLFANSEWARLAAQLCPIACVLLIAAALYAQWTVDSVTGLVTGFRASPVSFRALVVSRALGGLCILAVQMLVFCSILAIRF